MKNNNNISRRKFITSAATCAATASVFSLAPQVLHGSNEEEATTKKDIITRMLGRTKMTLPVVSMGAMNASLPELVQASYDLGVRHFDTAAIYQYGS